MVFWANSHIPAFTLYFLSRPVFLYQSGTRQLLLPVFTASITAITGAWWAYNYLINFMEVIYPFINDCNRNVGFKSWPANSYERISFLPKLGLTSPEFKLGVCPS